MALANSELSVWEIAWRWAVEDPDLAVLPIPIDVRDHLRNIVGAIWGCELNSSLSMEHWSATYGSEPQEHVRYWAAEIQEIIEGISYNRKFLRFVRVERTDFEEWCKGNGFNLPVFWFHPDPSPGVPPKPLASAVAGDDGGDADGIGDTPEAKLRPNQAAKIACQQVARNLWKVDPARTIASMLADPAIRQLAGGGSYAAKTLRNWIKVVAPPQVRERRGRPRKEK